MFALSLSHTHIFSIKIERAASILTDYSHSSADKTFTMGFVTIERKGHLKDSYHFLHRLIKIMQTILRENMTTVIWSTMNTNMKMTTLVTTISELVICTIPIHSKMTRLTTMSTVTNFRCHPKKFKVSEKEIKILTLT